MTASQETPEVRRDLPTIALRLETFRNMKAKLAVIPDEIRPVDVDALAAEANTKKIVDNLRGELKADLKWLMGFLTENRPPNAEYFQAMKLFDTILEVI